MSAPRGKPAAHIYASRRHAVRAARMACREALRAPYYQAAEGHDFIIHPSSNQDLYSGRLEHLSLTYQVRAGRYSGPSRFELCGPALEAKQEQQA